MHVYEVRPRRDHRGVDLISDALPFGGLWYAGPNAISNAIGYAQHRSRSHRAVIRVYDTAGNVIETHEHRGDFKEWWPYQIVGVSDSFSAILHFLSFYLQPTFLKMNCAYDM